MSQTRRTLHRVPRPASLPLSTLLVSTALVLSATVAARAQTTPFAPEPLARALKNEISGDRAFNVVRRLTPFHRIMGSRAYVEAAEMLAGLAREAGLRNVSIVRQPFEGGLSWDARTARLSLVTPEERKIADFGDVAVSLAVFSRSAHVTAELVDILDSSPAALKDIDVAGKIVLTTAAPSTAIRNAVWERGALGVVSCGGIHPEARFDTPDQVAYIKVPAAVPAGKAQPWSFMISPRQYDELQALLRKSAAAGAKVTVRADIDTEIREPAAQAFLWAEIPGSEIHHQKIVLTAHLDEESTSANDNGSGCGALLEVGRALNALIESGQIPRPRRDIVFWWPNEHWSEYQMLRDRPEERRSWFASLNMDMVGARQSLGSRVQHVIRTPDSLPSWLNDVAESLTEYLVLSHTGSLAAEEAGTPQPFSKPILAFLGSRERYDAMMMPFSDGSDHEVFCEGVVRVPAVGLINNPDPYFHSSDDDLWNIDRTQLQRNAFLVAAAALFAANAGEADVPMLTNEVYSRAVRRLGGNLNTALAHAREGRSETPQASFDDARNIVDRAAERERGALESVLAFTSPAAPGAARVRDAVRSLDRLAGEMRRTLEAERPAAAGRGIAAAAPPSGTVERSLAEMVPSNAESLADYFGRRGWAVSFPGLHPVMAKEAYNFVDGRRTGLDIYRAVKAESLMAGEAYYGRVTPDAVKALLDDAVKKGTLRLRPASAEKR